MSGPCTACGALALLPEPPAAASQQSLATASEAPTISAEGLLAAACGGRWPRSGLVLVSGEPGAGKSTLVAAAAAALGGRVELIDAEMSAGVARATWERGGGAAALERVTRHEINSASEARAALAESTAPIVVIDSVHAAEPNPMGRAELLRQLADHVRSYRGARIVFAIAQANGAGRAHGGHVLEHYGDAVIVVRADEVHALKCRWSVATRVARV